MLNSTDVTVINSHKTCLFTFDPTYKSLHFTPFAHFLAYFSMFTTVWVHDLTLVFGKKTLSAISPSQSE